MIEKLGNDDYPAELAYTYYMIHALDGLGKRTQSVWQEIHPYVASTLYQDAEGVIQAMVWNPSSEIQTVVFRDDTGLIKSVQVQPKTFIRVVFE